jgi:undecaprenyl-diphosphatase
MMNALLAADLAFEQLLLSIRTPLGVQFWSDVTFFGSVTTIAVLALVVAVFLYRKRRWPLLAGLVLTLGGAGATAFILKEVVARARPGALLQAIAETGYSFPSGHASMAMAFYGFAAYIEANLYPRYRGAAAVIAIVLILGIGVSRLYLGVHYPTDVLGGYAVGGLWVLLGILLTRRTHALLDFDAKKE